jgi:hypothetical protein
MYKRPYGYAGSIYAQTNVPAPAANQMNLRLPSSADLLPSGFYYIWQP